MTELAFFLVVMADVLIVDLYLKRRAERLWGNMLRRYLKGMRCKHSEDRLNGSY